MTVLEVAQALVFFGAVGLIVVLAMAVGDRVRPLDDEPREDAA